jgi:hypothetical protein
MSYRLTTRTTGPFSGMAGAFRATVVQLKIFIIFLITFCLVAIF